MTARFESHVPGGPWPRGVDPPSRDPCRLGFDEASAVAVEIGHEDSTDFNDSIVCFSLPLGIRYLNEETTGGNCD